LYKNIKLQNKEDARYYIAFGVCLQKLKHWGQSSKNDRERA